MVLSSTYLTSGQRHTRLAIYSYCIVGLVIQGEWFAGWQGLAVSAILREKKRDGLCLQKVVKNKIPTGQEWPTILYQQSTNGY